MKSEQKGVTLIELMIVVAIIGILSAIAYPSYQQYILSSWRATASGCVLSLAQNMEWRYTSNMSYDNGDAGATPPVPATLPVASCTTENGIASRYTFNATIAATTYTIRAVPQITDAQCGTLSITQTGARGAGTGSVQDCW
ncbi:MAG: type IV pilin protein [Pseudomonadales bacterium]